tara:strand:+ start:1534 stop:1671 length:138 start_codon:yes stop_codon:yes gene_type:complete
MDLDDADLCDDWVVSVATRREDDQTDQQYSDGAHSGDSNHQYLGG